MAINLGPAAGGVMSDAQIAMLNSAASRAAGYGPKSPADQDLANRRALTDEAFRNVRALLNPRAAGQDAPFGPGVLAAMLARATQAAGARQRGANMLIDRQFAGSGLANSGGALAARRSAQRQAQQDTFANRQQIRAQAELENYAAKERATAALASILGPEVAYQGSMNVVQETENPFLAMFPGLMNGGMSIPGAAGGGGGGGFQLPALDNWYTQWQQQQAQSEEMAAQQRARMAALPGRTPAVPPGPWQGTAALHSAPGAPPLAQQQYGPTGQPTGPWSKPVFNSGLLGLVAGNVRPGGMQDGGFAGARRLTPEQQLRKVRGY